MNTRVLPESFFSKLFTYYKYVLGASYFIGFLLHALDVMDMRLNFSKMDLMWKSWILFLLIFDFIASAGLILNKFWGEVAFIIVALAQLTAYLGFSSFFGDQTFLIFFHITCLVIYGFFRSQDFKKALTPNTFPEKS